jgi:hypothetical protein
MRVLWKLQLLSSNVAEYDDTNSFLNESQDGPAMESICDFSLPPSYFQAKCPIGLIYSKAHRHHDGDTSNHSDQARKRSDVVKLCDHPEAVL